MSVNWEQYWRSRAELAEAEVERLKQEVIWSSALADRLAEALRWGWPGISGESYERPISEVHAAVTAALAAYDEARRDPR